MNVSVIVVCYNEEKNIEDCLTSLIGQNYPADRFEIIVVDGGSQDNTQNIIKRFVAKHSNIKLFVQPKKGTASGRNAGIKASLYDYVAFIDADCEAPADWLTTLVNKFEKNVTLNNRLVAVGGRNIPPEYGNRFLQAIEIALDSFVGSFRSVQGRQFIKEKYVSSLATLNVFYDKQKLINIGGYDESLGSEAEDAELNFRLFSAGHQFLFIPDSFVWHKMRLTPKIWFKNMFRYGKGRARLLKRYPRMWNFCYLLPLLFLAAMLSILFIPFFKVFYLSAFYFPGIFCFSLFQCLRKKSPALTLQVMFVYLTQHFGYAIGEIYGLIYPKVK